MAKIKIYDGSNWIELLKSSDISSWAKSSTKPSYTASEVGAIPLSGTGALTGSIIPSTDNNKQLGDYNKRFSYIYGTLGIFDKVRTKSNNASSDDSFADIYTDDNGNIFFRYNDGDETNKYYKLIGGSTSSSTPSQIALQSDLSSYIPKTLTTTKGDIIYASAANTPARLGIGTSGQILRVSSSGVPEWATVSTGGGSGTLYEHRVFITSDEGYVEGLSVGFTILSNVSSVVSDTISSVAKHVYDCGYIDGAYAYFLPATGTIFNANGTIKDIIMGVYATKNGSTYKLYAVPSDGNYYPNSFEIPSSLYCFVHARSITLS